MPSPASKINKVPFLLITMDERNLFSEGIAADVPKKVISKLDMISSD
jgi:hypothetical protein